MFQQFYFWRGGKWQKLWNKKWLRLTAYTFGVLILFGVLLNIIFPLSINIPYSQVVTASDGSVLHAFLSSDQKWRLKTELHEITPTLKKAIINKEDKYFYYHPGVNPVSIVRAVVNNLLSARKASGASTITMQVARLIAPKERTYLNKLTEVFRAFQRYLMNLFIGHVRESPGRAVCHPLPFGHDHSSLGISLRIPLGPGLGPRSH